MWFLGCFFLVFSASAQSPRYSFEPLFESGGGPAVLRSPAGACWRNLDSAEELVSRVLGKECRGVLLVGSHAALQRMRALSPAGVPPECVLTITTDSHRYLAEAFFRATHQESRLGVLWGCVFARGVITIPDGDFANGDLGRFWDALSALVPPRSGGSWLGRSLVELGRSLFCRLKKAYDWMMDFII